VSELAANEDATPSAVAPMHGESTAGTAPVRPLPASAVAVPAMRRLQGIASRAVAEVGYRVTRVGSAGLGGLVLISVAIATFVMVNLPQRASIEALRAAAVQPAATGGSGLAAAQVGKVLTGLPPRSGAPEVLEKILAQAKDAGVELDRGKYEFVPSRDGVAAHYRVQLPVTTTYPQLRSFMDKTLLALSGVGVEGLRIERKSIGDERIEADVKLAIYVKDGG
jgi:hypothetical protein